MNTEIMIDALMLGLNWEQASKITSLHQLNMLNFFDLNNVSNELIQGTTKINKHYQVEACKILSSTNRFDPANGTYMNYSTNLVDHCSKYTNQYAVEALQDFKNQTNNYALLSMIDSNTKLTLLKAFGIDYLSTIADSFNTSEVIESCIKKFSGQENVRYLETQFDALIVLVKNANIDKEDLKINIDLILKFQHYIQANALVELLPAPTNQCTKFVSVEKIINEALSYTTYLQLQALEILGPANSDLALQFKEVWQSESLRYCEKTHPYSKYSNYLTEDDYHHMIGEAVLKSTQFGEC